MSIRTGARRLVSALIIGLAAVCGFPAAAGAVDHLMEVNEVSVAHGGNSAAQYIEILDPFNEPFPSPPYRLVVFDRNGVRLGAHELGGDAQIIDNNVPMLISTAAADAALGVTGHQVLSVSLPTDAGQISFTRGLAEQKIHTITYGCINTAVTNTAINFGPAPTSTQSSQLQPSNQLTLGTPTPKAANVAGTATANCVGEGYARPKAATPSNVRLVPSFNNCPGSSPTGMTHGPPLATPSCSPPTESSNFLTFNAPERLAPYFGSAAGTGLLTLKVTCMTTPPTENGDSPPCNANVGDQEDVRLTTSLNDVRCKNNGSQPNCAGAPNTAGQPYSGKVLLRIVLRMTDRLNGPTNNPGTVSDVTFPVGLQCTSGACSSTTSTDSVYPNVVQEQRRAVWQLRSVEVLDGGTDGNLAPNPSPATGVCPPACQGNGGETVFMTQGFFVP
jgi:hypothetical protein